jgi:hypothetical protein
MFTNYGIILCLIRALGKCLQVCANETRRTICKLKARLKFL